MDAERFDAVARSLSSETSRRVLLGLASGLMMTVPLTIGDDAQAKRRRKKRRKRIRCSCDGLVCGPNSCGRGSCGQCGSCQLCDNGACVNLGNDTACDGAGRCLSGVCNQPPNCISFDGICSTTNPTVCCANFCSPIIDTAGKCLTKGPAGTRCNGAADCASNTCTGFRCQ